MKSQKSYLVVLFFLIGAVPCATAQVAFGPKAGVNLTNLKVSDPEGSYNSRTGYHAGVFLTGKFSKIAIQPEVLFFTQSTDAKETLLGNYKDNFTYVSVPVMLKFYIVSGLNLQLGPQFGFLIDGERKYSTRLGQGTTDIKDYYKNSDVSVSLGGGWDLPFGLNVDVRYNIGVQDINNWADGEETKSRIFLISLGWNFLK
jgi:hypothetical protein